jgi:hypothetical protein
MPPSALTTAAKCQWFSILQAIFGPLTSVDHLHVFVAKCCYQFGDFGDICEATLPLADWIKVRLNWQSCIHNFVIAYSSCT